MQLWKYLKFVIFLPLYPVTNMPVIHFHYVFGWLLTFYFYKEDSLKDPLSDSNWEMRLKTTTG